MQKLILPLTFFLLLSLQVFSQDFILENEELPITTEELINARVTELKNLMSSEGTQLGLCDNHFLTEIYVVDEWILQNWNNVSNMWDNFAKYDPIYNSQDLLIDDRVLSWNGASWENSSRHYYTYTGTNLEATDTYQTWGGANWIDNSRLSTNYDVNNRPVEYLYETWSGVSWENSYRYLEQYNTQGNLETEIYQTWNGASWDNIYKYTYTYNSADLIIEELTQIFIAGWINWTYNTRSYNTMGSILTQVFYDWSGIAWENNTQYLYTYDSNNNKIHHLSQNWDPINGWVNYGQYLYQYDGSNNQTEQLLQLWDTIGNSWVNYDKYNYTYNSQNLLLTQLYQLWNTGTGWENSSYLMTSYDANNNPSERVLQTWDGSSWVNFARQTGFIWILITDVGSDEFFANEFKLYNNYPNPFNPSTIIKFNIPSTNDVKIKVYDVLGNEITTLINEEKSAGSFKVEFDATTLPSGVYFYRLQAESFVETKKMVLMK